MNKKSITSAFIILLIEWQSLLNRYFAFLYYIILILAKLLINLDKIKKSVQSTDNDGDDFGISDLSDFDKFGMMNTLIMNQRS
ncbi:unnamed protein product [Paramecium octaurelia]|uniref:Uncharacterized protein n=1 Tax=Paramecium octaurelia TaxID=43137 RepID=A0A8S1SE85_PAROT|nr:unnamed protein product [Paramecium octaurelia]